MGPCMREDNGGAGWVPAYARTNGRGGMVPRIREEKGGRLGARMHEDNGEGDGSPAFARTREGGWVWRWRGTLPTGRGREKMGPRLREDGRGRDIREGMVAGEGDLQQGYVGSGGEGDGSPHPRGQRGRGDEVGPRMREDNGGRGDGSPRSRGQTGQEGGW